MYAAELSKKGRGCCVINVGKEQEEEESIE